MSILKYLKSRNLGNNPLPDPSVEVSEVAREQTETLTLITVNMLISIIFGKLLNVNITSFAVVLGNDVTLNPQCLPSAILPGAF